MELRHHSEYQSVYLANQQLTERCRAAVCAWLAEERTLQVEQYDLIWTVDRTRDFVQALSALFQAYNQVLWQQFRYCGECTGLCCVVDASDIRVFDCIALTLLDLAAPALPTRIDAGPRTCIYLNGNRCTWPDAWRTIKCWSFYCLGSSPWEPARYRAITDALRNVVNEMLPAELRRYEEIANISLVEQLEDPVEFAAQFHAALDQIFVHPFHQHYPILETSTSIPHLDSHPSQSVGVPNIFLQDPDVLFFVVEATEALAEGIDESDLGVPVSAEQFMDDLELLTWIVEGQPAQREQLLRDLAARYVQATKAMDKEAIPLGYRMYHQIQQLLVA